MRAAKIFRVVSFVAIFIAVAFWFHERATATALNARLTALSGEEQRLSDLRAERTRLRGQLSAVDRPTNSLPVVAADYSRNRPAAPAATDAFALGKWTPVAAWKKEGRSTPRSTVSTLLWAAAGGDLAEVQKILQFDTTAHNAARAWFDALPAATRSLYATPEDLVASVTMGRIPPTNAELSWFHETDADNAIVGIMLAGPLSPRPDTAASIQPSVANEPPFLKSNNTNLLAVLNLVRTPDGWRVAVPVAAIERMAKVLSVPTPH
jgi:hypothetical protein